MTSIIERIWSFVSRLLPRRFRAAAIVPVVRLAGVIGITAPLRPGLTITSCARNLERAFTTRGARAVALVINSPGGAAVQSHLIFRRIRSLADEHKLPVIAFVEDVAASGGYMIACAADEIICDESSIIGSIGVVAATFGLEKLIEKIGVERRIYTSGENKVMLDPFLPEKKDDVDRLKALQKEIHEDFIALVKARRAGKLESRETALFTGEFWTGAKARELGLVDAIGDLRSHLRERYGDKVKMPVIAERGWLGRRSATVAGVMGVTDIVDQVASRPGIADEILSTFEARALWARYGL